MDCYRTFTIWWMALGKCNFGANLASTGIMLFQFYYIMSELGNMCVENTILHQH